MRQWISKESGVDFAVIEKDGKEQTVFLEMNDGYALGNYGLQHILLLLDEGEIKREFVTGFSFPYFTLIRVQ